MNATAPAVFADTRDHRVYISSLSYLTELAKSDQLTRPELDAAMNAFYDDGDSFDRSIGFEWITRNHQLFSQTARRCQFSVRAFLTEHAHLDWVGSRILLCNELIKLVKQESFDVLLAASQKVADESITRNSREETESFVREIYCRYGAFNNGWIKTVIQCGVQQSTVAEIILEKLEAAPATYGRTTNPTAVTNFIEWGGAGDGLGECMYARSPWAALSSEQFARAMSICAGKALSYFLDKRSRIEQRIGKEQFEVLARAAVIEVAAHNGALTEVEQTFVQEQTLDIQVAVAGGLKKGAAILLSLLLNPAMKNAQEVYATMHHLLDAESAAGIASLYANTYVARHHSNGSGIARLDWLEKDLERRLSEAGYIIGVVSEGTFTPRNRDGSRGNLRAQLEVNVNRQTYVENRRQRGDYYPQVGDRVLINTEAATALTPWVKAAVFQLVHRPAKTGK